MSNVNINATSFYWNPTLRHRYELEGLYEDVLNRRNKLGQDILKIVTDVDLSQRQKAKKLSELIATFSGDQMDVILAILDTKFDTLSDIFEEETPFEFLYRGKLLELSLGSLNEWTNVIWIGSKAEEGFIPLSQYTTTEDFNDVLDGKVEYEDIVDNWMFVNNSEHDEDLSVTVLSSDGWHPMECFREHPTWYKALSEDFSKLYNAYEQQEITQKFLDENKISAHEDGLLMSENDEDFELDAFEDAMADAIIEIPEYLGYYGLEKWFELLVNKTNERQEIVNYHIYKWLGYSQGESGYILIRVNLKTVPSFYKFVDGIVSRKGAIARGDSYIKHEVN